MSEESKEKITFKEIEQLESAVKSFSRSTNWIKKLSTPLTSAIALPVFNESIAFHKVAFVLFVLFLFAWFLDSYCFYYQRKLRIVIEKKYKVLDPDWPYGLAETKEVDWIDSLFNKSHILYYIILGILFMPFVLELGKIVCFSCKT